jgi:hypothetical protein
MYRNYDIDETINGNFNNLLRNLPKDNVINNSLQDGVYGEAYSDAQDDAYNGAKYDVQDEYGLFDDNNSEFIQFKEEVKEWLALDDDIRTLQDAIKKRKVRKDILNKNILEYMAKFKINDLNTKDGTIKFAKSLTTKPLNKQFLISKLGDFFRDFSKGEKVATFILNNRDKEEKFRLRRVLEKKK